MVAAARGRLPPGVEDHIAGAAGTETTMRRNRLRLDSLAFRPRVLRDVSVIDTQARLLGHSFRLPVVLAPIGSLHTITPAAAIEAVRAAGSFGIGSFVSSVVEPGFEEIATASDAPRFFQLYVRGDAIEVGALLDRVVAAGYSGIAITVDSPYYGIRDRQRLGKWQPPAERRSGREYQAKLTWATIAEIRERSAGLPLLLKGIQTGEDARLAIEHGIEAVYVSNHGGRQLDHCQATIDVLPEVVGAVGGRAEIIVDGGFGRGTDVVKALALGATAVGVGRLYAWALAAAGEAGVIRMLELLEEEIRNVMGLLGATSYAELAPSFVTAAVPAPSWEQA